MTRLSRRRFAQSLLALPWVSSAVRAAEETTTLELGTPEVLAQTEGLRLDRQRWELGNTRGWFWRARAARTAILQVRAVPEASAFESLLPTDSGPWIAINGGFYDVDLLPMGLVVSDDEEIAPYRRGGGSGIIEVRGGRIEIVHRSEFRPGTSQALQSIDRIVAAGRSLLDPRVNARIAARSAVAIGASSLWFVLAAGDELWPLSGSQTTLHTASTRGLPLWLMSEYLCDHLHISDALNLDGSVSVQLAARIGDYSLEIKGLGKTVNALIMRPMSA